MPNLLDPEKYRGKYVSSDGKIIFFDWRLHFNNVYEFSVVRQPTPLGRVTSVSRFQGRFEKVEGTIYRELEAYNISPKIFNEFDEEEPDEAYNLKEFRMGIRFNGGPGQLALMIGELADYKKMAENLATPSDVWKKMAPTSLNLAKGSSWFYFSSQPTKQIVFMRVTPKTEEKGSVIKEQLRYYIEDEKMRDLTGTLLGKETDDIFKEYNGGVEEAMKRENEAVMRGGEGSAGSLEEAEEAAIE